MKMVWYYAQYLLLPLVFIIAVLQGVVNAFYTTMDAIEEHRSARPGSTPDRAERYVESFKSLSENDGE